MKQETYQDLEPDYKKLLKPGKNKTQLEEFLEQEETAYRLRSLLDSGKLTMKEYIKLTNG